jgi:hypothetical protein
VRRVDNHARAPAAIASTQHTATISTTTPWTLAWSLWLPYAGLPAKTIAGARLNRPPAIRPMPTQTTNIRHSAIAQIQGDQSTCDHHDRVQDVERQNNRDREVRPVVTPLADKQETRPARPNQAAYERRADDRSEPGRRSRFHPLVVTLPDRRCHAYRLPLTGTRGQEENDNARRSLESPARRANEPSPHAPDSACACVGTEPTQLPLASPYPRRRQCRVWRSS